LLKSGKLQLSQQQARAQEAEVSRLSKMIDLFNISSEIFVFFYSKGRKGGLLEVLTKNREWFSIEYRKTKSKVITLANHQEDRQSSEPIKTRRKRVQLTQGLENGCVRYF